MTSTHKHTSTYAKQNNSVIELSLCVFLRCTPRELTCILSGKKWADAKLNMALQTHNSQQKQPASSWTAQKNLSSLSRVWTSKRVHNSLDTEKTETRAWPDEFTVCEVTEEALLQLLSDGWELGKLEPATEHTLLYKRPTLHFNSVFTCQNSSWRLLDHNLSQLIWDFWEEQNAVSCGLGHQQKLIYGKAWVVGFENWL